MLSSQSVAGVEESRFEAASVLARIHVEQVFQSLYFLLAIFSVGSLFAFMENNVSYPQPLFT